MLMKLHTNTTALCMFVLWLAGYLLYTKGYLAIGLAVHTLLIVSMVAVLFNEISKSAGIRKGI